jgi:site-specific recombinase XerD
MTWGGTALKEVKANNFLNTMRALFAWARDAELVEIDPTADVKNVKLRSLRGAG